MKKIAHCSEELCDWEEFKEKYACAIVCPFQKMCNNSDDDSKSCAINYGLNKAVYSGGKNDAFLIITLLVLSEIF